LSGTLSPRYVLRHGSWCNTPFLSALLFPFNIQIKFMHYTEARKEYDAGNQLYVPRPKLYFKSLFEKMDKLFGGQTAVRRSPIPAQANTRP